MLYLLFAQIPTPTGTEVLAGSSGWTGVGILGLLLAWLLFRYIPEKDRQSAEKDARIQSIITAGYDSTKNLMVANQKNVDAILEANRQSAEALQKHCHEELTKVADTVVRVYDVIVKRKQEIWEWEARNPNVVRPPINL